MSALLFNKITRVLWKSLMKLHSCALMNLPNGCNYGGNPPDGKMAKLHESRQQMDCPSFKSFLFFIIKINNNRNSLAYNCLGGWDPKTLAGPCKGQTLALSHSRNVFQRLSGEVISTSFEPLLHSKWMERVWWWHREH